MFREYFYDASSVRDVAAAIDKSLPRTRALIRELIQLIL